MRNAEYHLELLLASHLVVRELITILPQTDLIETLDVVVHIQLEILSRIINSSGYKKSELTSIEEDLDSILQEIMQLSHINKKQINGTTCSLSSEKPK